MPKELAVQGQIEPLKKWLLKAQFSLELPILLTI